MAVTTQDVRKPRFYAGLYLRTKRQIRFWGWGKREWESASIAEAAQSRWALADWLRMAHSLLDGKTLESPSPSAVPDKSAKSDCAG
jgi:hypothetical protein